MRWARLYLYALWLPLVLIAVISIGEAILKNFWWHQMSRATGYFLLSGMMCGIQYLLFAAFATWRFHRMDARFLSRLSWVMPVMFFPLCFVGIWVFFQWAEMHANRAQYYTTQEEQDSILNSSIMLGTYCVFGSYLYVSIVHLVGWFLDKCGLMEERS